MKKFLTALCLMIRVVSTSFAAKSVVSIPMSANASSVEKSDTPDVIIVIVDDRGVIVDIIVIKQV